MTEEFLPSLRKKKKVTGGRRELDRQEINNSNPGVVKKEKVRR